jgi:hypothetical protein
MKINKVVVVVLALMFTSAAMWGQAVSTSQVSGVVQDQTGAVVPGAQVQMTLVNTGQVRSAVTDGNGYYIIQELAVGAYRLDVGKTGFSTYVQNGIVLQVGESPAINVTLAVGAQTQEITVQANAAMVETQSTGVGQVVNQDQVVDLPLNGREITQLVSLSGASAPSGGSVADLNSNKNYGAGNANMNNAVVTLAVAGGQGNSVNFVMDGGTNNNPRNSLNNALPFPDAIQEFNVQTSSLSARYGQNASAAVNLVTKSGTNAFHGDAFEFVRNFMFNSRAANAPTRDSLKRNQFGGVIGGPIKKDKLFFFGGYQGTILKSNPSTTTANVPTPAELSGDFSVVTANASLCGLTKGVVLDKTKFTNNVWDPTKNGGKAWAVTPLAQTILNALPLALTTGSLVQTACGQITVPRSANLTDKEAIGRVDYVLNSKNTIFARYFIAINDQPVTSDGKDFLELNTLAYHAKDQETTLGDTQTLTPNVINNIRLTGNRELALRIAVPVPFGGSTHNPQGLTGTGGDCTATPSAADCTINTVSLIPNYFPISVGAGGFGGFVGGGTNPGYFNTTLLQAADDVDWVKGNHQIAFGFDFMWRVSNTVNTRPDNGSLSFTGNGSADPSSPSAAGIGYADFMLGLLNPSSFTQGNSLLDNDYAPYYAAYVTDNWKVKRTFSLQVGLRYEPFIQEKNPQNHVSNFSIPAFVAEQHTTVYVNAPDGLFFPGDKGYPGNSNTNSDLNRWAPRIGLVWNPRGDGKMTIRAGYGIFDDAAELYDFNHEASNPPWGDIINASSNATATVPFNNPWALYPGGDPFPAVTHLSPTAAFPVNSTYTNQPINYKPTYSQQWNLSVQRQFGSWLFSGNYIANATRHLQGGYNADPTILVPGTVPGGQCTAGGTSASPTGVFVGGPFNGQLDGLPSGYAGACSASTGTPGNKVTNFTQRQYLYENAVNVSGGAGLIGSLPQMDDGETSNYNGLLLSVNHRMSNNFSVLANYTWSHCLQVPAQLEWQGANEYPVIQPNSPSDPNLNAYRRLEYHNCDSDERHVVNFALIAKTPKFSNRFMNAIVGGWQASVVGGFHTGTYSAITTGVDTSLTNQSGVTYAQQLTGVSQYAPNAGSAAAGNGCTLGPTGACTIRVNYLDTAVYTAPAVGTFAPNAWATNVENPHYFDVDTSLSRTFKVTESQSVQARWEVFNFDNHVNYGAPSTAMNSSTYGLITGLAGNYAPRIMQFALKYVF